MRYRIDDAELRRIDAEDGYRVKRFSRDLHRAFRKVMNLIRAVADQQGLYAFKSLRLEKLVGDRKGQHSLRLNDQFRLIVRFDRDKTGQVLIIVELVDYH